MAINKEGVVNRAKAKPLPNPTQGSPVRAQAEKTNNVCPQGRATVKHPNKKVDHPLSFNKRVEIQRYKRLSREFFIEFRGLMFSPKSFRTPAPMRKIPQRRLVISER